MGKKKSKNSNLTRARIQCNNEFFTQLSSIEQEAVYYRKHFKDRIIFCNCDDPEESNFWKYFMLNFEFFGLRKLIATHYDTEKPTYKLELEKIDGELKTTKTPLKQNGDFKSDECIELLKEADMVVTNPPFSEFRCFVTTLMKYNKEFLIMGNQNAITYKEIFPLIKDNKIWLGVNTNKTMEFEVPDYYDISKNGRIDEEGRRLVKVPAISWFTNLEHNKRNEELILWETYTPEKFPKYDNYDAINVDKVAEIPLNYTEIKEVKKDELEELEASGFIFDILEENGKDLKVEIKNPVMGVPITFLNKYCPSQFEIVAFRKGDDGKDLVFTREREFNHTFVSLFDVDSRNDKELGRRNKWESYLRKNNNAEEDLEPVDCFYPVATNLQNTLVNDCTVNGKKTYVRVLIRRKL